MAWDDGDKGNPWRSDKDKGPADLDAVVRDFQRKLAGLFRGVRPGGTGGRSGEPQGVNGGLLFGGVLVLIGIWALTGIYKVDEAERGVVLRFGAYHELTRPGLRWHLPWPIETVERINIGATERRDYRGRMLTRDENIVDVALVVQFRRTDPEGFLFNMRDPEDALAAVTASAIREVIGRNLLDFILTDGRTEIARDTQDLLQATLDSYGAGITVYEVNLQEANFPREVEGAFKRRSRRARTASGKVLEAETYSNDSSADGPGRGLSPPAGRRGVSRGGDRQCGRRGRPFHGDSGASTRKRRRSHASACTSRRSRRSLANSTKGHRRHGGRQQPAVPAARRARGAARHASRRPAKRLPMPATPMTENPRPRSRERRAAR